MTESTRLAPLSPLDHGPVSSWGITLGYVLKGTVDKVLLESAAKRMVSKWRLLAGHLEWSKQLSIWCVRIPLEGDVSHRLKFTTRHITASLNITTVGSTSAEVLVRPPLEYFQHSSTPSSISAYASSDTPFVSIHITEFLNCTCVGISVPHGVFDAYGAGQIVENLNAELHGKPWEAPVSFKTNIMRETLHSLAGEAPLYTEKPAPLLNFQHEFVRATIMNLTLCVARMLYDYFWGESEVKAVYLGEDVVGGLVERVKGEVKEFGKGWVSTGDVLLAWFLKALFSKETDSDSLYVSEAVSMRSLLAERDIAFETYHHNALMLMTMSPVSKRDLSSMSVADLAILHRQTIDSVRNLPFLQSYIHFGKENGVATVPACRKGTESLLVSNQTIGHLNNIDFGSEMCAFWIWVTPWAPDHSAFTYVNKFKGGYIVTARVRSARWKAVEEELQKLNMGTPSSKYLELPLTPC